jgi:hypothetical protein
MEVVDKIALIVGDPRGISGWEFRPHPIHLLNVFVIISITF